MSHPVGSFVVCVISAFSKTSRHSGLEAGKVYRVADAFSSPGGAPHIALEGVRGCYYAQRFAACPDERLDGLRELLAARAA